MNNSTISNDAETTRDGFRQESCLTQDGVHLLLIVLQPLIDYIRLLEKQLDPSKKDIRDFYRYFDAYTCLLLLNLQHVQDFMTSPESEPFANFILTRLDAVVSEDIRRTYPKPTVSARDHPFFEDV